MGFPTEEVTLREGIRVREITNEEGNRLLRIVRRSSGSVVTWRRAQMVLLSAQGMDVAQIAKVAFTSPDRVRAVLHNFNDDGFDSLVPRYSGGRPPTFTLPERREIKKIALSRPVDHDLPFSTWSLSKLAEFLVAEGVVDDISHEGLRLVLREEGVSFQVIKTYKAVERPRLRGQEEPGARTSTKSPMGRRNRSQGIQTSCICFDEFGPLNLLPRPGKQWAPVAIKGEGNAESPRRRRRRATFTRFGGVRHLMAAYDLQAGQDLRPHQDEEGPHRPSWSSAATCARLYPAARPHGHRARQLQPTPLHQEGRPGSGVWAEANNVELAYVPTNASWMNRIEAQFQALRYFTLDGTDHRSHEEQNSMIRRYIAWRNRNAHDKTLRELVKRGKRCLMRH